MAEETAVNAQITDAVEQTNDNPLDDRGLAAEVDLGAVDSGRVFERVLDERGA